MKYLLSLLWQLMRLECFASLRSILKGTGKNQEVTEASVIAWAQQKVEQASPWGGSIVPTPLKGFNDPSVSTGIFLLALVESTSRGAVPEHLIKVESCTENNLSNAKLAICSAWKLGIPILCRPTDIVQVNERMIVSFVATLMAFTETLRAEAAKRVQVFY
jgi:plastin-1